MTDQPNTNQPADALAELASQLLACGGPLSQMITHMVQCQASGRSAPDAAPVPEVAYSLVRDAISGLAQRHRDEDIHAAAAIVGEATEAICENIMFVPLDVN